MKRKKEEFNRDAEVCYLYRSKELNQYSIENVFSYIRDSLRDKIQISESYVPNGRIGMKEIMNNLSYVKSIHADIYHITGDIHYVSIVLPKKKLYSQFMI